ncbi:MAG: ribonuclease HII [Nanoarchaeota archaeon]|nr:ribonuclease HII [Nanoarchaeota archaeon]
MTKILGIDDAGRGPVIGPMTLAGVIIDENENEELKSYGVKDSKLLTPKNRKLIKEKINSRFKSHIEISSPKEIDESTNLNYLEAIKSAMIINKLTKEETDKVKVIIDCPSTNLKAWREDVWKLLEKKEIINLTVEHKADLNHPTVSAASILAKEKREDEIEKLKMDLDIDFGSGYPADPKTKEFIKNNFENKSYKSIIRYSWNTVKRLQKAKKQKKLF